MMNMFLQPYLMQLAQAQGFVGLQFMGSQNLYDTMQARQFQMDQQAAMTQAAQADRLNFISQMRGAHQAFGGTWGAGQAAAAERLFTNFVGPAQPVLAMMMPDLLDSMYGRKGSATVMAQRIMGASPILMDPVTGGFGLTGESAGFISRRLHEDLYGT